MELDFASFALGFTAGLVIFAFGMIMGRIESGGSVKSLFIKEKPVPPEDVPGTDEYYEKARLAPEEGGHENHADPFEQDLIELNRHSGEF